MAEIVAGSRTASGDNVVLTAKRHWGAFVWPIFWTVIFALPPPHTFAIIPLIWVAWMFVKWSRTHVVLTTRRLNGQQGVISLTTFDLRLNKIESILFNASLIGKMLDYGSIEVRGTGSTRFIFRHIAKAKSFKEAVDREIDAAHEGPQTS